MKRLTITLLVLAAGLFFSCEAPDQEFFSGIATDPHSLEFAYTGGELTLNVRATVSWTITPADSWCTVSPSRGDGDAVVTVSATANPDKVDSRKTKLSVQYDDVTFFVTVTQEKNPEEAVFSIDRNSVDVPGAGGEFEICVISDVVEYEITIVDDWITEISREGDRVTGETIHFQAAPNDRNAERSGVVSVCTKDGSCIPVMVNQAASGIPTFVHTNIGFRFTATWCGYCPYMDEAFHKLADDSSVIFDYITFHASQGYPLYLADGANLANYYVVQGYPTGVVNGWKELNNYLDTDYTANNAKNDIAKFESHFPCVAGISVNSTISGETLNLKATVMAPGGDYLVSAFLLESGIVATQTYYPASGGSTKLTDFVHDNVARKTITKSPRGDAFTMTEATQQFEWNVDLSSEWVKENLSVAVLVMRPYGSYAEFKSANNYPDNYVVNAVVAPAGSSKEMQYE